jgi:hypothetical protein
LIPLITLIKLSSSGGCFLPRDGEQATEQETTQTVNNIERQELITRDHRQRGTQKGKNRLKNLLLIHTRVLTRGEAETAERTGGGKDSEEKLEEPGTRETLRKT